MLALLSIAWLSQSALVTSSSTPAFVVSSTSDSIAVPTPPGSVLSDGERPPRYVKPWVAGWSSVAFPGLGLHFLGEHRRGFGYLGVETAELFATSATLATSGYDPHDPDTADRLNRVLLPGVWLQDTHFLGVYDAWRTARLKAPPGAYTIPDPDAMHLLRAPLRFSLLGRARVGLPLAAVAAAGVTFSLLYEPKDRVADPTFWESSRLPLFSHEVPKGQAAAGGEAYYATTFYMVGIGEESVFRGIVQTTLEEKWGPTWGWLGASAIFGAAHILNNPTSLRAASTQAVATAAIGSYLGWIYDHDGHDLTADTFMHCWYDFLVGSTLFLSDPKHQPFSASLSVPF